MDNSNKVLESWENVRDSCIGIFVLIVGIGFIFILTIGIIGAIKNTPNKNICIKECKEIFNSTYTQEGDRCLTRNGGTFDDWFYSPECKIDKNGEQGWFKQNVGWYNYSLGRFKNTIGNGEI